LEGSASRQLDLQISNLCPAATLLLVAAPAALLQGRGYIDKTFRARLQPSALGRQRLPVAMRCFLM